MYPRRTRQERIAKLFELFIGECLLWPLGGWALMIALGILHSEVASAVPALGFWICLPLVVLASLVKSAVAPNIPDD